MLNRIFDKGVDACYFVLCVVVGCVCVWFRVQASYCVAGAFAVCSLKHEVEAFITFSLCTSRQLTNRSLLVPVGMLPTAACTAV